jgi:hypothetical protein
VAGKAKGEGALKLVTEETRDVEKQFRELFERANGKSRGAEEAAARMRGLMGDNPAEKLWRRVQGPMICAIEYALEKSPGATPGVRECWRAQLEDIRKRLAGEEASEVESLLARHAALCWLRLAQVEVKHSAFTSGEHTLTSGAYWDKRLSMAQRRFVKACESLERVRMMMRRGATINLTPSRAANVA